MKKRICLASIFTVFTALIIFMICTVDVAPIGPMGTKVGLSTINKTVFDYFGVSPFLSTLTKSLELLAFAIVGIEALVGLVQLIKRKNLFKVDKEILASGVLYIIMFSIYVIFENIVVNYRPVLEEGQTFPEASFPSSHSLFIFITCSTVFILCERYFKNKNLINILKTVSVLVIAVMLFGRVASGIHWFSDILAAACISSTLISWYVVYLFSCNKKSAQTD